ncbi:putative GPI-anchored cell wall protein Pst1 [Aspergillus melleus]|uniref:putative GPI-anchored cell wall protein Pst1 n=1 Tax=Aspergillus melleus TaxID=138277 RepID=UPI001E8EF003|nr:uncharacterized protein LDX57_002687 [Aspergillus melleus]KAH8424941.1 hypothetical protein LDX57_002687 [Aspergillus melleus]
MIPFLWFGIALATLHLHPGVARADDSSSSSCTGEIKISKQSDADALSSCDTISGTLVIAPSASGTISIPNVEEIKGPLTIKDADDLNAVRAEDLETVTGPVTIENNKRLTSLKFEELGSVGGEVKIKGNDVLKEIGFDDLESVNGGLEVVGGFVGLSLSNLEKVRGVTSIVSTAKEFTCSALDSLHSDGVFGSDFTCKNDASSSSSSDSDNDKNDGNSDSDKENAGGGGLSPGAKAGIAVGVIIGVLIILLGIWFCIRRQRRQRMAQKEAMAGLAAGGAAAAIAGSKGPSGGGGGGGGGISDEEKGTSDNTTTTTSSVSPVSPDDMTANALAIPRKPLSPAPQETGIVSIAGTDSALGTNSNSAIGSGTRSTSLPSALVAGESDPRFSTVSALGSSDQSESLFLRPMPRRIPSESDVPMLDSGDVHEAPAQSARELDPPFELDAGPVRGTHQQAINHE